MKININIVYRKIKRLDCKTDAEEWLQHVQKLKLIIFDNKIIGPIRWRFTFRNNETGEISECDSSNASNCQSNQNILIK